ncbi:MAG: response regulator [Candidatus Dadabacteria bacterium]
MKRILIIEDDDAVRENTAELLDVNNYDVVTASNGTTGFELAKRNRPDLILCDMMMPETDGRTFLKLAKDDGDIKDVPVIFFSAGTLPVKDQNVLIKEADGFLKKPFLEEDLLRIVRTVLEHKHVLPDSTEAV